MGRDLGIGGSWEGERVPVDLERGHTGQDGMVVERVGSDPCREGCRAVILGHVGKFINVISGSRDGIGGGEGTYAEMDTVPVTCKQV